MWECHVALGVRGRGKMTKQRITDRCRLRAVGWFVKKFHSNSAKPKNLYFYIFFL